MMKTDLNAILEAAKAASIAKSLEIWDRDGREDRGSCGGAVMILDGRSALAKLAIETGFAWNSGGDIFVNSFIGEGIRSQNADIRQDAAEAFRQVLIDRGQAKAIKKFWTYVD